MNYASIPTKLLSRLQHGPFYARTLGQVTLSGVVSLAMFILTMPVTHIRFLALNTHRSTHFMMILELPVTTKMSWWGTFPKAHLAHSETVNLSIPQRSHHFARVHVDRVCKTQHHTIKLQTNATHPWQVQYVYASVFVSLSVAVFAFVTVCPSVCVCISYMVDGVSMREWLSMARAQMPHCNALPNRHADHEKKQMEPEQFSRNRDGKASQMCI